MAFRRDHFFLACYQQILKIPGVDHIEKALITVEKQQYPECTDVQIKPASLVFSTEHEVLVNYAF